MERVIYVDIEPQKPFLTQYTRRLLLDCLKGVKCLKENDYVTTKDIFETTTKINTSDQSIRLYFYIVHYDDSFPTQHTLHNNNTNDTIGSLQQKVNQLETLLMEYHLDLEFPWNHRSYIEAGEVLQEQSLNS